MRFLSKQSKIFLVGLLFLFPLLTLAQNPQRFPRPDFGSDYTRPELQTPVPRATILEYVDLGVLVLVLSLATYLALKQRSRRNIFLLMVFSLAYFGFYRKGCVCSIGAIQNASYALFTPEYAIPIFVVLFFILPLAFTLFYGRTFCGAVCPIGAIQDAVIIKPAKVPAWLANVLGILPYLYLGLAILFAVTGAEFIICRFDPFIGFFRFGADFGMVIFGMSMLLLGTVVARPYCRFLCPYGVLLGWMSRLSKKHAKITPDECDNCRLCEASCPFGAIKIPDESPSPANRKTEVKKLAFLFALLPVVVFASGWVGSQLNVPLSRLHSTVSLAEEVLLEDSGQRAEMTDETTAFRASGTPKEALFAEARTVRNQFRVGGWILGGFIGLVICLKLINFFLRRRQLEYEIDRGICFSCGRCFEYCPHEQVRLGVITPTEAGALGNREIKIKQFRA